MKYKHISVMLDEVLDYLNPRAGQKFIDCTLGGAGYTIEIAKKVGGKGKVLGIDADVMAIKNAEKKIQEQGLNNIILVNDNFKNLKKITEKNLKGIKFDGIVMDLGLSSAQLDDRRRGFSFLADTPLKMEFGTGENETEDIVNYWDEEELAQIIKDYGEERFAKRIAKKIIEYRKNNKIKTTGQLVEIIKEAIPKRFWQKNIHPATRTFQALRIVTNNELKNLESVLPQAIDLLNKGGRLVVVSFHSLEDRIVKNFFRQESKNCICSSDVYICQCNHKAKIKKINKKVILPSKEEIANNPRSRSAKMRVVEKL